MGTMNRELKSLKELRGEKGKKRMDERVIIENQYNITTTLQEERVQDFSFLVGTMEQMLESVVTRVVQRELQGFADGLAQAMQQAMGNGVQAIVQEQLPAVMKEMEEQVLENMGVIVEKQESSNITEVQEELKEEFDIADEVVDKYAHLYTPKGFVRWKHPDYTAEEVFYIMLDKLVEEGSDITKPATVIKANSAVYQKGLKLFNNSWEEAVQNYIANK